MLVLTRKTNEAIRIGKDVRLVVVELCPTHVRIGIEAPREVPVHREEVFHAIERNESEGKR